MILLQNIKYDILTLLQSLMRKLSLTFPQEIKQELELLCLEQPKLCKKEGAMGWTSNERIVVLRKGYFEYYNAHPGFIQDQPSTIRSKNFKAAVGLDFIHEVNFLPKNKIRKTHLELIFPRDKKVVRMPTQTQMNESEAVDVTNRENELEKWVFQFKFDVKDKIQQKRQQLKQQKRKSALLANQPESPNESIQPISFFYTGEPDQNQILQEEDRVHEKNIEEYVESVKKTKLFLKNKAQMAEQEAARQRKKKERQIAELSAKHQSVEDEFHITSFWRDYYRAYEVVMKDSKQKKSPEIILQSQLNLLKLVQYFNTIAIKIVQSYVDQRCIGWQNVKKQHQNFKYYQGIWLRVGGKQLNQQFLVNYYINDIFSSLRQIKNIKFRLPLMSLFKYKGFKILAMCDLPFSEIQKSEIYNLTDDGFDLQLMNKLKQNLQIVEDILNVKSEPIDTDQKKKIVAPLGINLKIYQYNFKKDKTTDQNTLPHFYYLINPGIVFPLDYLAQTQVKQPLARLRPQLVAAYRDYLIDDNTQLLSQAFMTSSMPLQFKRQEDQKVLDATKGLLKSKISSFTNKLNQIDLLIVDSYSLKTMMEENGINVRHMNYIYEKADLPYIREHLKVQALARTIKKQFRDALNEHEMLQRGKRRQYQRMKTTDRLRIIKEKQEETQEQYKAMAIDYLNLVFGKGPQTDNFWHIIIQKCFKNYKIQCKYPLKVKPGLLLHAVLWHCNITASYSIDIPLFMAERPFSSSTKINFKISVKTFDYPSFMIQKLFRAAPSLEDNVSMQAFTQSTSKLLKLQLLFHNVLKFSFQASIALAKMSNFRQFLTKVEGQNPFHPAIIPFYFINKSQNNFYKALDVIKFSLPETHPLIVTLHHEYTSIFEPELFQKTALMLAVKNFGQFHPKTTDLYSQLYHKGMTEHHIKALRIKNIEESKKLCNELYQDKKYESCLNYCLEQINRMNLGANSEKIGSGNFESYLFMLMQGLDSTIKVAQLNKGIEISHQISQVISSFKYRDQEATYLLFQRVLVLNLLLSEKKYFLYKMVLLAVHIRTQHEKVPLDEEGNTLPIGKKQRQYFLEGLTTQYEERKTHSNWIRYVIDNLLKSFKYFNYLEDLFNNYAIHIKNYNNVTFKYCLGYWDILIRLYGQALFKSTLYDIRFN